MTFTAHINVMPLKDLLDPQGKAVEGGLKNLNLSAIRQVRIGKHMSMELEAASAAQAKELVEEACRRLLANPVMEYYEIQIQG